MSIPVEWPIGSLESAVATFHLEHGREHNYSRPDAPVEVYRLQVRATGLVRKAEFGTHVRTSKSRAEPVGVRTVRFDEHDKAVQTPVFNRDHLGPGEMLEGPAIVEQLDSTTLIPPGIKAEVDEHLTIKMYVPLDRAN